MIVRNDEVLPLEYLPFDSISDLFLLLPYLLFGEYASDPLWTQTGILEFDSYFKITWWCDLYIIGTQATFILWLKASVKHKAWTSFLSSYGYVLQPPGCPAYINSICDVV